MTGCLYYVFCHFTPAADLQFSFLHLFPFLSTSLLTLLSSTLSSTLETPSFPVGQFYHFFFYFFILSPVYCMNFFLTLQPLYINLSMYPKPYTGSKDLLFLVLFLSFLSLFPLLLAIFIKRIVSLSLSSLHPPKRAPYTLHRPSRPPSFSLSHFFPFVPSLFPFPSFFHTVSLVTSLSPNSFPCVSTLLVSSP